MIQALDALRVISDKLEDSPTNVLEFYDFNLPKQSLPPLTLKRQLSTTSSEDEDFQVKRRRTQSFCNLALIQSGSMNNISHAVSSVSDSSCETDPLELFHEIDATNKTNNKIANANTEGCQQGGSYGWFVEMDDDSNGGGGPNTSVDAYASARNASKDNLAFSAAVSPCEHEKDEENELAWATAADAVDDVLGDFF